MVRTVRGQIHFEDRSYILNLLIEEKREKLKHVGEMFQGSVRPDGGEKILH